MSTTSIALRPGIAETFNISIDIDAGEARRALTPATIDATANPITST